MSAAGDRSSEAGKGDGAEEWQQLQNRGRCDRSWDYGWRAKAAGGWEQAPPIQYTEQYTASLPEVRPPWKGRPGGAWGDRYA